jgi:uncharacterized protein (TIGR03067 family)
MLIVLAAGLSVRVGSVSGVPTRRHKEDVVRSALEKLQGTWVCVEGRMSDAEVGPSSNARLVLAHTHTLAIRGDHVVKDDAEKYTLTVNPTKNPKWFDLRPKGKEGQATIGIYEINGDWLRVCYTYSGKERPIRLSVKEGAKDRPVNLWTYKRKAKSK